MKLDLLQENNNISTNIISTYRKTDSFFNEAVIDIIAIEKNKLSIMENYYQKIYEANDDISLVMEATNGLLEGIKSIIDKFIALIKKIVTKFLTAMNGIIKSDKYIRKYKNRFKEFDSECEFDMDINIFTYIDNDNYPNLHAYEVYKTDNFSGAKKDARDLTDYTNALYTQFTEGLADWYDIFRGKVLADDTNSITPYSSSEYSKELYRKFRNGDDGKINTTITSSEVNIAYNRFDNYDKTLKHVEKMKTNLIKEYDRIKKDIKNITAAYDNSNFTSVLGNDYDITSGINTLDQEYSEADKKKKIDANITSFINAKAEQINQMSIIHSMAFTAKLDAIKDAYTQDKKLLYAALKKINKKHNYTLKESYIDEGLDNIPEFIDSISEGHSNIIDTKGDVIK